jgi:hypothetical protein
MTSVDELRNVPISFQIHHHCCGHTKQQCNQIAFRPVVEWNPTFSRLKFFVNSLKPIHFKSLLINSKQSIKKTRKSPVREGVGKAEFRALPERDKDRETWICSILNIKIASLILWYSRVSEDHHRTTWNTGLFCPYLELYSYQVLIWILCRTWKSWKPINWFENPPTLILQIKASSESRALQFNWQFSILSKRQRMWWWQTRAEYPSSAKPLLRMSSTQ